MKCHGFVPFTTYCMPFGLNSPNLHLPFLLRATRPHHWIHPFRLTMKGVLSHTREDTLSWSVLVVSFLYMNCIWLHACLALKKKKGKKNSNHALKPITCCTFDIIFYLSKNYLTRSPSWDEHISFSRVSWPTSRHQVNTLFQFQYSIRDKLTCRGFAKWIRSQISSSKSLTSCWRLH